MDLTDAQLEQVNAERRKRGLPPLTRGEARRVLQERAYAGDDPASYLIGLLAGASVMTTESAFGVVPRTPAPAAPEIFEGGGGSSGGGGASASFEAPDTSAPDTSVGSDSSLGSSIGDAGGSSSPSG